MEETRLAMQKRPDSGLPGAFCSRWQENNPLSVLSGGFVQRVPKGLTCEPQNEGCELLDGQCDGYLPHRC